MKFSISVEYKNKFHEYPLPSVSNVEMRLNLSEVDCPYSIKLSAFDKQWKIKVTGLKAGETSITAKATYTVEINGSLQSFSENIVILVNVTDDTQNIDNE